MIPSIELLTEEITEEKYPNRTYKIEDGVGVVHADSEVSGQGSVTITDQSPHEHNVNVKLESYLPTDFSPKRTGRNLIPVESGGTLTFKNQYGYAVPNKVTFDLDSSESDSSVAYVKDVPKTNFPVAKVNQIGGVTRKTKNLFDPAPIGTKTFIGLTYTTQNGYVKINGTKASGANIHIMTAPNMTLPAGTYTVSVRMISGTVSGIEGTGGVFFGINQNTYGQRTTPGVSKVGDVGVRTFTLSEPTLVSSFDIAPDYGSVGAVFDNAVFACQFEKSDTATEYEPYFEGLRSAPVTEVESVGVNLAQVNTVPFPAKDGIVIFEGKISGDVVLSWKHNLTGLTTTSAALFSWEYEDGTAGYDVAIGNSKGYVFIANKTVTRIFVRNWCGATGGSVYDIMLNKGTEALPYRPYTRNTLPIPEAVQALDGYGDGVNESVYNYIDLDAKQFVKRVGKVDLGTLTWVYSVNSTIFYSAGLAGSAKGGGCVVCDKFTSVVGLAAVQSTDKSIGLAGDKTLYAHDSAYTDAATFKAALSGVMLYYELATPVVTDISDLLPSYDVTLTARGEDLIPYTTYTPNEDGVIENIKSISPTMILETNFNDITINAVYQKTVQISTPVCANLTDDLDAIKQAIRLILSCERYEYLIYSWDYGVELVDLIGQPMPYVMSELPRRITEALTTDDRITDVVDFEFEPHGKKLYTTFTVVTDMGNIPTELEVDI